MTLDDLGLVEALRDMLHNWRDDSRKLIGNGILVGDFTGLADTLQVTVYRVVQECTTNCVRHAEASHVRVEVKREKQFIKVHCNR